MEYHRDDRYLSEIEVLLVLDKGPADAQFHEGHSQGPYPTASPTKHLQLSGRTTVVAGLCDAGVPVCLQDFSFLLSQR